MSRRRNKSRKRIRTGRPDIPQQAPRIKFLNKPIDFESCSPMASRLAQHIDDKLIIGYDPGGLDMSAVAVRHPDGRLEIAYQGRDIYAELADVIYSAPSASRAPGKRAALGASFGKAKP